MYEAAIASWVQRPAPPLFTDADVENSYYRAHAPRSGRVLQSLASIIAFVGLVSFVLDRML